LAGSQAIGQGIANLGQGIASGIEQYQKQKKENKAIDAKIKENNTLFESLKPVVDKLPPQFQQIYSSYAQKIHDPSLSRVDQLSLSEGGVKALSQIMNLGMQTQEQQTALESQNRIASAALALSGEGMGPVPAANRAAMLLQQGYTPSQVVAAQELYGKSEAQRAGTEKTFAEAEAAKTPKIKPTAIVYPDEATARKAGEAANPGFAVKVEPGSNGGFIYSAAQPLPKNPNPYEEMVSKQLFALDDAAKRAPQAIDRINNQIKLLDEGNVNVGFIGDIKQGVDKLKTLLGDKESANTVTNTEILDNLLGSDLLDQIKQAGLTTRSFDTPAEMENLRRALTGSRQLQPEALKQIALIRKKNYEQLAERYNDLVDRGAYNPMYSLYGTGSQPRKIELPSLSQSIPTAVKPASGETTTIGRFQVLETK
jgi:hypothetical protein